MWVGHDVHVVNDYIQTSVVSTLRSIFLGVWVGVAWTRWSLALAKLNIEWLCNATQLSELQHVSSQPLVCRRNYVALFCLLWFQSKKKLRKPNIIRGHWQSHMIDPCIKEWKSKTEHTTGMEGNTCTIELPWFWWQTRRQNWYIMWFVKTFSVLGQKLQSHDLPNSNHCRGNAGLLGLQCGREQLISRQSSALHIHICIYIKIMVLSPTTWIEVSWDTDCDTTSKHHKSMDLWLPFWPFWLILGARFYGKDHALYANLILGPRFAWESGSLRKQVKMGARCNLESTLAQGAYIYVFISHVNVVVCFCFLQIGQESIKLCFLRFLNNNPSYIQPSLCIWDLL